MVSQSASPLPLGLAHHKAPPSRTTGLGFAHIVGDIAQTAMTPMAGFRAWPGSPIYLVGRVYLVGRETSSGERFAAWGGQFVRVWDGRTTMWSDDPNPALAEGVHAGARSVNQWREAWLRDFAAHMRRGAGCNS